MDCICGLYKNFIWKLEGNKFVAFSESFYLEKEVESLDAGIDCIERIVESCKDK